MVFMLFLDLINIRVLSQLLIYFFNFPFLFVLTLIPKITVLIGRWSRYTSHSLYMIIHIKSSSCLIFCIFLHSFPFCNISLINLFHRVQILLNRVVLNISPRNILMVVILEHYLWCYGY